MADFTIKRNDRLPELIATCLGPDGAPADLATALSVDFHMTKVGDAIPKINAAAVLITPTLGLVKYVWSATDTDTSGDYTGEFEVLFTGARTETFPNQKSANMTISITDDLA